MSGRTFLAPVPSRIATVAAALTVALALPWAPSFGAQAPATDQPSTYEAELLSEFTARTARQAVAVDETYFYSVGNRVISKHRKEDGALVAEWPGPDEENHLIHIDSLVEHEGRLYAAHSNYPHYPMTSSVELWDASTLRHVDSISLGVNRGSFTWLDRHEDQWWGAFANYDKVQAGSAAPYGLTDNTQIVRFDEHFRVVESWVLPRSILDRMRPMSNSGGSWGADGLLYLTGHDHHEIYVTRLPSMGSTLEHVTTVHVPILEGQGLAWDRSIHGRELWGINKAMTRIVRLQVPTIHHAP